MSTAAGGMASPRRRKPYTMESLARALEQRLQQDVIEGYEAPSRERPTWHVAARDGITLDLTSACLYAFLCGITAGRRPPDA